MDIALTTHVHELEQFTSATACVGGRPAVKLQGYANVFRSGQTANQMEPLKHEADVVEAHSGSFITPQRADVIPHNMDFATIGRQHATDNREQRRLAAPGRPHEKNALSGPGR
jgi:hypothetical protein